MDWKRKRKGQTGSGEIEAAESRAGNDGKDGDEETAGEDMFRVDVKGLRRKFANKSRNFLLYELYQNAVYPADHDR
jgi:hypothetical protein